MPDDNSHYDVMKRVLLKGLHWFKFVFAELLN